MIQHPISTLLRQPILYHNENFASIKRGDPTLTDPLMVLLNICLWLYMVNFFFCPSISLWAFNELTNFWKSHSTWSKKMDVRSTHDVQLFDQKFHISFNLVPAWSKTMKDNMANCFGLIIALSSLKGYGGFEYFIWCCFRYGLEAIPHRQSNQKALVQVKCFTNILGKHEHLKWLYLDYKTILWSTSNLTFPLRS